MTTDSRLLSLHSQSDAAVRAWGSGISQALQTCGLVRTNDTGQVDWSTYARSLPYNNATQYFTVGYEIFRFTDALQSTAPVFIKVEYYFPQDVNTYYAQFTYTQPTLIVSVATGTNGSGTLTGQVSSRLDWMRSPPYGVYSGSSTIGNGLPSSSSQMHTSGDGSSIQCVIGANTTQPTWTIQLNALKLAALPAMLWIERTRDIEGNPNGDGVLFGTSCWYAGNGDQTVAGNIGFYNNSQIITPSNVSVLDSGWPLSWPGEQFASGVSGADVSVWPPSISTPKMQQAMGFLGIYRGDLGLDSIVDLPVLGRPHRYRAMAGIAGVLPNDNARSRAHPSIASSALLMRWE